MLTGFGKIPAGEHVETQPIPSETLPSAPLEPQPQVQVQTQLHHAPTASMEMHVPPSLMTTVMVHVTAAGHGLLMTQLNGLLMMPNADARFEQILTFVSIYSHYFLIKSCLAYKLAS